MPKQLSVILGMHRSGTSLITKSLELVGYSLGDNLMPEREDNPKGFFEDVDVVALNDELLRASSSSWDTLQLSPDVRIITDKKLIKKANGLLKRKLNKTNKLAIKDPRMCLLLPFWRDRFEALDIRVSYIVVHRNPIDVAASLSKRNGFTIRHGLLLDYFYSREIMHFLENDGLVINYAEFMEDPARQVGRIAEHLEETVDADALTEFTNEFVDRSLWHNNQDQLVTDNSLPVLDKLSNLMLDLSAGKQISVQKFLKKNKTTLELEHELLNIEVSRLVDLRYSYDDDAAEREKVILPLESEQKLARAEIEDLTRRLSEREAHVSALDGQIKNFTRNLVIANESLDNSESELTEKEKHISLLNEQIEEIRGDVTRSNDALNQREKQVAERESHVEALKTEVDDIRGQLAKSRQAIADRDEQVNEREKHVALLKEQFDGLEAQLMKSNEILKQRDTELKQERQSQDQLTQLYEKKLDEYAKQVAGYQRHVDDYDRMLRDVHGSISYSLGRILTFPVRKPFTALILPIFHKNPAALRLLGFVRTSVGHPIKTLQLLSIRRIRNFYRLLTEKQALVDQVVTNYEEIYKEEPAHQVTSEPEYKPDKLRDFKLTLPTSEEPLVSVLIPVFNQLEYTLKCLQSIADHAPTVPFEVIVADDCSTDQTEEVLADIEGLRVVRHPENLKFLLNCNRAVDFCQGEYIFLLNNDTVVKEGWLDMLLAVFEDRADAGIVGSKLIYPDGRLQEAGGIVWQDGSAWNFGRLQDADAPEYNYVREADYISGAAIMFPRQLFLDLGKFDEHFVPAYYEDTDLAFKVRQAGKKVYYQPRSVVVHFEGISHGTDETAGLKQYQVANFEKFEAKWRDVLAEHYPNAEEVFVARERSQKKTTVLVIDHYVPHFDKDAGSRSTYLYLKLLCQAGCNVKFIGDNYYQHEPYTSVLQQMGIEVLYGNHYYNNWKSWLVDNCHNIDVIYLMRPHITEVYIDIINALPTKPKTIYFGHDLHYLRLERQAELSGDIEVKEEAQFWRNKEFELFDKVDMIYYPSEVEVEEIHKSRPDLPAKAIPLYAFEKFNEQHVDFSQRSGMMFVGGFNHPPNADGLTWFIESVLPAVVAEQPNICLHVVGSNMPDEIAALDGEHIKVHGFLSDEELANLYQSVRLSVVPLRFGAGIKGKVLEAMDNGVPVITTHIGAEGIPDSRRSMVIEDEAEDMTAAILKVYGDAQQLEYYSANARGVVRDSFSPEAVLRVIAEDFIIQLP